MPKIAYWTGWLSPEKEAVSREAFALHGHFRGSFVFGLSRYYRLRFSARERYFGCHVKLFPLLRMLSPLWERTFDLHHVIGSAESWHLLSLARKKPLVLTAALPGRLMPGFDYGMLSRLVVECSRDEAKYAAQGIPREKIRKIYPGVRIPAAVSRGREYGDKGKWTLLWASAPHDKKDWLVRRVDLIFDLLDADGSLELLVLGRKWPSDSLRELREMAGLRGISGRVRTIDRVFARFEEMYDLADITVAPFQQDKAKPCPLSVVESMACGKPVLVSSQVGIADTVAECGAGGVFDLELASLKNALDRVRGDYAASRRRARQCAEKHFALDRFLNEYEKLYAEII